MKSNALSSKFFQLAFVTALVFTCGQQAHAVPLALTDVPLFLTTNAPPLNLLVVGRDHKLFYEAYNDHSDLDGDGTLDINYKPTITYYGYFDSLKCYEYSSSNRRFEPTSATANKKCSGSNEWSGDWLNYVTMSRMDALRKVLYGGYRSTDTTSETVLERAYIPQDAHSWGKSYESVAVNGYDIADYTPLSAPNANSSHLFANTTPQGATVPRLRVLENQQYGDGTPLKVWHWLSIERPVAGNEVVTGVTAGGSEIRTTVSGIQDYRVRVLVCASTPTAPVPNEPNCRPYVNGATTIYKPAGLLQEYGEDDRMKFGLLTGSYSNNTDGGILRKAVTSFKNEVDLTTGIFTNPSGIVATLNGLRVAGFKSDYSHECSNGGSAWIVNRPINDGECQNWGNPIAEMMYEGLRYFAGKSGPTSDFAASAGAGLESGLGLPVATWDSNTDPYKASGSNPNGWCAKPFETVISDINVSYDSDKVPGSAFASFSGDVSGLNASTLAQKIWNNEFGNGATKNVFIGEVAGSSVTGPALSAPTPKTISSFGTLRGLAPEEPTKQGSYYAASVAHFGLTNDISTAPNTQSMSTFAVALASPLPRIEITVDGKKVTLIPFAKSVNNYGISPTSSFQPTNQIVDFYVESLTATSGKFRVNFEDVEQGADHDMDAVVLYEYTVSGSTVTVKLTSEYAAGSITQHMGYIISGTTQDGIYLEVRDTDTSTDVDYALDTPGSATPYGTAGAAPTDGQPLPLVATRTFTPGNTPGAELLNDPLWYAAKWGGFQDGNKDGLPSPKSEWDSDNNNVPDNYFLVSNALTLGPRMANAFDEILRRTGSASSASVNSGTISLNSRVYQATFESGKWIGHLFSFTVGNNGTLTSTAEWDAADNIPKPTARNIVTRDSSGAAVNFTWAALSSDATRVAQLDATSTTNAQKILNYLRGDNANEANNGGTFRIREGKLGDIINSSPIYMGPPNYRYPDSFESKPYSAFASAQKTRPPVIFVGANDGMLHAFDATPSTGKGTELFAYIPGAVFKNLAQLAAPGYTHKYFVDGTPTVADAFFQAPGESSTEWHSVLVGGLNHGGQSIYALDVTDPTNFTTNDVLWEYEDADLGYTFSQPIITKANNGEWVVIFGNGYNNSETDGTPSTTGHAYLYIVRLRDGALLAKIDTGVGSTLTPNGLAMPAVVDNNRDLIADYVYAGDLRGNLWKFDIRGTTASSWRVAYTDGSGNPEPLYVAKDRHGNAQPITVRPEVVRGPGGTGMALLFGTGKYLENSDKLVSSSLTAPEQSLYGIFDLNVSASDAFSGRSNLTQQTITQELSVSTSGAPRNVRITSNTPPTANSRGWYLDLVSPSGYQAERVITKPIVRAGRVVFTTMRPKNGVCDNGGTGWLMELDPLTGTRLADSPFDVNRDNKIDGQDLVSGLPASGIESEVDIITSPGVLTSPNSGLEFKFSAGTSGSIQMTVESADPKRIGRQSWRSER